MVDEIRRIIQRIKNAGSFYKLKWFVIVLALINIGTHFSFPTLFVIMGFIELQIDDNIKKGKEIRRQRQTIENWINETINQEEDEVIFDAGLPEESDDEQNQSNSDLESEDDKIFD